MVPGLRGSSARGMGLVAAWLCALAVPALAAGADVAILPFDRRDVDVDLSAALGDSFQVAFSRASTLNVVSQGDIAATLGYEKQMQLVGCENGTCLAELGGALGVPYLVVGRFARVGSAYLLLVKLVDVKKGGMAASDQETVPAGDERGLLEGVQRLGTRFGHTVGVQLGRVGDWPSAEGPAEAVPPVVPVPPPVVEPPPAPLAVPVVPAVDDEEEDKEETERPAKKPRAAKASSGPPLTAISAVANAVAGLACGLSCLGLCVSGLFTGTVALFDPDGTYTLLASLVGIPCCLGCGASLLSLVIGVPVTSVLAFRGGGKDALDEDEDRPARRRKAKQAGSDDDE